MQEESEQNKNFRVAGDAVISTVKLKKHRKKRGRVSKFEKRYSQIKGIIPEERRIDYILVHPRKKSSEVKNEKDKKDLQTHENRRKLFEEAIQHEGFKIHEDVIGDHVYKKLHCPFIRLCIEAEKTKLELPLKDCKIEKEKSSCIDDFWDKFETDDTADFISAPFDMDRIELFKDYEDPTNFFRPALRALLTHHILINIDISAQLVDDDDPKNDEDEETGCLPFGKSKAKDDVKTKKDAKENKKDDKNRVLRRKGLLYLLMKDDYTDSFILHDESDESKKKEDSSKRGELSRFLEDEDLEYEPEALERDARKELDEKWTKFYKFQPLWRIRDYYGEKIALYFAWSGTLITTIYLPTLFGFCVFIYGLFLSIEKNQERLETSSSNSTIGNLAETVQDLLYVIRESFDNEVTPWFALVICLWGTIFLEYWKRRNALLAYEWDVDDFEDKQPDRPQFYGTKVTTDPITLEDNWIYPFANKLLKLLMSGGALLFMITLVLMSVFAVIIYRVIVSVDLCPDMDASSCLLVSTILSSVLNAVSILILGKIYDKLAVILTDWENHRTQTEYDDALIIKLFCFQFVNSYASCFYIAFFRGRFDEDGVLGRGDAYKDGCKQSCMSQLSFQVLVLMLMKPFPKLFKDIILPLLKRLWRKRPSFCCRKTCFKKNQVEEEKPEKLKFGEKKRLCQHAFLEKERLKPQLGDFTLSEYTEKVIQYGFLMLFTASFPLAPLIALVTNYIDLRVDAKRLLWWYRRPIAFIAQDIGTWYGILQFVNFCGVISNAFLIGFTSTWANKHYPDTASRLWIVLFFEHIVFVAKFILAYLIPDTPSEVQLAIRREKFQVKAIMNAGKYEMRTDFTDVYKSKQLRSRIKTPSPSKSDNATTGEPVQSSFKWEHISTLTKEAADQDSPPWYIPDVPTTFDYKINLSKKTLTPSKSSDKTISVNPVHLPPLTKKEADQDSTLWYLPDAPKPLENKISLSESNGAVSVSGVDTSPESRSPSKRVHRRLSKNNFGPEDVIEESANEMDDMTDRFASDGDSDTNRYQSTV